MYGLGKFFIGCVVSKPVFENQMYMFLVGNPQGSPPAGSNNGPRGG
jgi:hypothetical protein